MQAASRHCPFPAFPALIEHRLLHHCEHESRFFTLEEVAAVSPVLAKYYRNTPSEHILICEHHLRQDFRDLFGERKFWEKVKNTEEFHQMLRTFNTLHTQHIYADLIKFETLFFILARFARFSIHPQNRSKNSLLALQRASDSNERLQFMLNHLLPMKSPRNFQVSAPDVPPPAAPRHRRRTKFPPPAPPSPPDAVFVTFEEMQAKLSACGGLVPATFAPPLLTKQLPMKPVDLAEVIQCFRCGLANRPNEEPIQFEHSNFNHATALCPECKEADDADYALGFVHPRMNRPILPRFKIPGPECFTYLCLFPETRETCGKCKREGKKTYLLSWDEGTYCLDHAFQQIRAKRRELAGNELENLYDFPLFTTPMIAPVLNNNSDSPPHIFPAHPVTGFPYLVATKTTGKKRIFPRSKELLRCAMATEILQDVQWHSTVMRHKRLRAGRSKISDEELIEEDEAQDEEHSEEDEDDENEDASDHSSGSADSRPTKKPRTASSAGPPPPPSKLPAAKLPDFSMKEFLDDEYVEELSPPVRHNQRQEQLHQQCNTQISYLSKKVDDLEQKIMEMEKDRNDATKMMQHMFNKMQQFMTNPGHFTHPAAAAAAAEPSTPRNMADVLPPVSTPTSGPFTALVQMAEQQTHTSMQKVSGFTSKDDEASILMYTSAGLEGLGMLDS